MKQILSKIKWCLQRNFLHNKQKLFTFVTADIGTLGIFDQEFIGSPYCKEWALSNVFFLPFFPHKVEITISQSLKVKIIKSIVCGFTGK